jgi:hypothetical protein
MFNHPGLLYLIWRDAERESRKIPDNNNGSGGGCLIVIGIMFIICLFQAAFEVGGSAIFIAILITLGLISGFINK